jgi:SAM-dependent methyltransferase
MPNILDSVVKYYSSKIKQFGPCPQGVDWNSEKSQILRFEQILKVCRSTMNFSINDFGCGYGALVDYMMEQDYKFSYYGFDLSSAMINQAKKLYSSLSNCSFITDGGVLQRRDYSVASGVFNVRQNESIHIWKKYVSEILDQLDCLSSHGFSFNMLTKYSDVELRRNSLYYADPSYYFDLCKKKYSKNVSILHDYDLFEFTILVRK